MRLTLIFLLSTFFCFAQKAPRFTKYDIGDSGFKIYLPSAPAPVTKEFSPDSSLVYTIESNDSTMGALFHFGAIVVKLKDVKADEELLTMYLEYLKTSFKIKSAAGYGKGHVLESHPSAKGVIDYWKDESEAEWQIVGWYAENYLVVQFEYGPKEIPFYSVWEMFKNGIQFPQK